MEDFSISIYNDKNKQLCSFVFFTMFLIILVFITPLSEFSSFSLFGKIIILIILGYTIRISFFQNSFLNSIDKTKLSSNISSQLNLNTISSYLFTFFLVLLFVFIIKSFF